MVEASEGDARHECALTQPRLLQLLQGHMPSAEQLRLREHLANCPECKRAYADTLQAVAELSRATRQAQQRGSAHTPRRHPVRGPISAALARGGRVPMRASLLVLVVAIAIAIVTVARRSDRAHAVAWLEGSALAGVQQLDATHPRAAVGKGQWIATRADGRVLLEADGSEVELESETQVLLESAVPLRLRLEAGCVSLRGSMQLASSFGVLEQGRSARSSARLGARGLELECAEGELRVHTSRGTQIVTAGGRATLGALGELAFRAAN